MMKEEIVEILKDYNLGRYVSGKHLWWVFGNTIIDFKTTKGRFILKTFHTQNKRNLDLQIEIGKKLLKGKLPLPKFVKTKKKEILIRRKKHYRLIQEFVEGKHTHKFTKPLVINCASTLSKMDKILSRIKSESLFGYKSNHQFTYKNFKIKRIGGFDLKKEAIKVNTELKTINRKRLRKRFIHGDFHGVNLLSNNEKITAVLDFDDSHYDYLIEEIAVFLGHSFVHKERIHKNYIKMFMKEYQKTIKLNENEKRAIYYFIRQRFLASLDWTEKHKRKLKDKKKIREVNKNIANSIKSYENLKEISEDDFIKLL